MDRRGYSRRNFLGQVVLAGGGAMFVAACTSGGGKPSARSSSNTLPSIEGGVVVTDAGQMPTTLSEAPEFAQLVAAGKLPPVAQRVGQDPLVIKPLRSIGKYGGELRRGFVGPQDHQNGRRFCTGPDHLLFWDYQFKHVVPYLARGYELSADAKVLTLHLRRGMRWSDGQPFTADDIIFWREDINLDDALSPGSSILRTDAGPVQVKKIDDVTVQFISPVPYPYLVKKMASRNTGAGQANNQPINNAGYAPKHYLSQFLPKYTSMAEANRKANDAGFKGYQLYLQQLMDWARNPDLPVLTPWVVTRPITNAPWELKANPYSIWVDTKGNQLPYIPKITMQDAGNSEVLKTQAVAGAYDFQDRGLDLPSLPVLVQNQKRSGYTVYRAPNNDMVFKLRLNLAYDADKTIGDLIRNVDFRRALSLGIDRDEVNKTFFSGVGTPSASMVADDNQYFPGSEWRTKWATHDPEQANRLLDGLGLTERDANGFRLRPDNKKTIRMDFNCVKTYLDFPAMCEMVRSQWRKIGIDASIRPELDSSFIYANTVIEALGGVPSDIFITQREILPTTDVTGVIGFPYAQWFESKGKQGVRPPQSLHLLEEMMNEYKRGLTVVSDSERIKIGKEIYRTHADQVWSIGVIGFAPGLYGLYLAKNDLGNVPRRIVNDEAVGTPVNALPITFYYE